MKTATHTSAGGVIFDEQGRIAITARLSIKGELQYGLPKGWVEKHEDARMAAAREAQEETGLEVEVLGELETSDYWFVQPARGSDPPMRVHKFVHWFLMRAIGGDPALHDDETEQVLLLHPKEATELASYPSERQVIEAAVRARLVT